MNLLLQKSRGLQIYLLITIAAFLVSQAMTRVVVVRPRLQLSQVSAISAMQIWYWVIVIIAVFVFILLKQKLLLAKDKLIEYILYFGIFLNITFVAAANNLALSKVPLPPGDIRGDNGALLSGMMRAAETGWSGNSYPPVWLSLVGNIARIFGEPVLEIWKPVFLISVVLLPGLVLLAWRQAFNPIAAAAVTFLFTFGTIEWKGIANLVMTAMFIAIAFEISNSKSSSFSFNPKLFAYGLIFGLSALTYYGYLWWSLLAITVLIVSLWFRKNREYLLIKVLDAGLGAILILGPSQLGPRLNLSGLMFILIIVSSIILRILVQRTNFICGVLGYLTGLSIPVAVIYILFSSTINDEWFYPELEINPVPNLGLGFNTSGIFFILITLVGLILAFSELRFRSAILVMATSFISAALMMFWWAARMEVTDKVELFPRAAGTFGFAWSVLTLIALIAILTSTYFSDFIRRVWPKKLSQVNNIFLTLVLLLPIVAIHARTLSEAQDGIFPIGENGVWLAYRACDNPHEDPMLAKVFEESPFIQDFLRENCPNVDWPVIPPINQAE